MVDMKANKQCFSLPCLPKEGMTMRRIKLSEKKIWTALSAVASSVLTDAIYDEFSEISYELQTVGQKVIFVPRDTLAFGEKALIIGSLFIVIWAVISLIMRGIDTLIDRLRFRNKKSFGADRIVADYNAARSIVLEVSNFFNHANELSTITQNDILVRTGEFVTAINILHRSFCPETKRQSKVVKSTFRTGSELCDVGKRITPYEYEAVVNIAGDVLELWQAIDDIPMVASDCEMINAAINDLKNVIRANP